MARYEVRPFRHSDIHQVGGGDSAPERTWRMMEWRIGARTLMINGAPAACGGIHEAWPGRGVCWSVIHHRIGRLGMLALHRVCRSEIEKACQRFHRLEMTVDMDFPEGHRWARMLGFRPEAVMMRYTPDARDRALYVRIP